MDDFLVVVLSAMMGLAVVAAVFYLAVILVGV